MDVATDHQADRTAMATGVVGRAGAGTVTGEGHDTASGAGRGRRRRRPGRARGRPGQALRADYDIFAERSPAAALQVLERLRRQQVAVALILADQWMPHMTGLDLLARTRALHPSARRLVLIGVWGRRPNEPMSPAITLALFDLWVLHPFAP